MTKSTFHFKLLKNIEKLAYASFSKKIDLNAVLIVGSNYKAASLSQLKQKNSDIDIIVLNNSEHFLINETFGGINYDISFINQNDLLGMFINAINGSKFFGKIFSSLNQFTLVHGSNEATKTLIKTINDLYSLFAETSLPNNSTNYVFLHNINANLKDSAKPKTGESFFAFHRLSNHLFDYVSHLVYSFNSSGSYRGKIIAKHFPDFTKDMIQFRDKIPMINQILLENKIKAFCPVRSTTFRSFTYTPCIGEKIKQGLIKTFYFGYKNLMSSETIIFLPKDKNLENDLMLEKVTSIIPLFSKNQMHYYIELLVHLSTNNFNSSIHQKTKIFYYITNLFIEAGLNKIIRKSLKAALVKKSLIDIQKEINNIEPHIFYNWFSNITISLNTTGFKSKKIGALVSKVLDTITTNPNNKIKEVEAVYVYFGIMKSLRINIEELSFDGN